MFKRAELLALAAIFVPLTAWAATVRVAFVAPGSPIEARGSLRLRGSDGAENEREIRVPGSVVLEVPEGTYVAELRVPGFWLPPQVVTVQDRLTLELPVRSTGRVTGTADGTVRLRIRFVDTANALLSGQIECPVEASSFDCELPEGNLDLRIAREGHVPHYRWQGPVRAGAVESVGTLVFAAGASISGRLEVEDGSKGDARVVLTSAGGKAAKIVVKPEKPGFFSAGPLPAGDYTLSAEQKGLISNPVAVTIREGMEATLREPLILARPRRLSLMISPPIDPIGVGWNVTVREIGAKLTARRVIAEGAASLDGSWIANNLLPGKYEVVVRPKGGPVWRMEEVAVADALTVRQIFVPSLRFEGTVKLGEKPIEAKLVFGGRNSETGIPWRSDEQGRFKGYMPVPESKQWVVTVSSDFPPIDVTLNDVPMHVNESAGVARFDIRLPMTMIEGLVVDEQDQPVPRALIKVDSLHADGRTTQIDGDNEGRFNVHALEPGRYRLTASDFLKESDALEFELTEEPLTLRVQLKSYRQWKGRIRTSNGQPVPRARLFAVAADVPIVNAYPARSDPDGTFVVLVPREAKLFDVMVAPEGFTYKFFRRPLSDALDIVVDPNGATLTVDWPEDRSVEPAIWHDGSVISGYTLLSGWLGEMEKPAAGVTRLRVPRMDPGSYTVCLVPAGTAVKTTPGPRCKSVWLAPFGESLVTLKAD